MDIRKRGFDRLACSIRISKGTIGPGRTSVGGLCDAAIAANGNDVAVVDEVNIDNSKTEGRRIAESPVRGIVLALCDDFLERKHDPEQ
jgi:hypothetical protein